MSQGIVLPILHGIGWPVFDTRVVAPEYALEGRRVDYALCDRTEQPRVFLEVKRVGQSEGGDRQLFEYAFVRGVPLAVLTDGQEWSFYLPGEQGHYEERRVYKLDLLERSPDDSAERLTRYLTYESVLDGTALQAARADYRDVTRQRQIEATLPRAWSALLQEQDSLLLDLLAEKVEDVCGFKPDPDTCSQFLSTVAPVVLSPRVTTPSRTQLVHPANRAPRVSGQWGYTIAGRRHSANSARDVLLGVLRAFTEADASFLDRFVARKHGRKRRYVARTRSELYPDRPDLAENYSVELLPGWWMGTNYSRRSIIEIIDLACEVAGVQRTDLGLQLG